MNKIIARNFFSKECDEISSGEPVYRECWKMYWTFERIGLNLCEEFAERAKFLSISEILKIYMNCAEVWKCWIR